MNLILQQIFAFARRYPIAVACFTLVVLLGIADYFLWQRQAELTRRHDRVQQDGEALMLALTTQGRLTTQLTTVQEAVSHIDKNLVIEGDLAGNSDYFYQIEKATHVRLSDLNQLNSQPAGDENPFRAIPFSLRLTGTYNQLIYFLHELETGPRLLRIKHYEFSRGSGAGGAAGADALALNLTVEMLGHP